MVAQYTCTKCGDTVYLENAMCADCNPDLNDLLIQMFRARRGAVLMDNPNVSDEYKVICVFGEYLADSPEKAIKKALGIIS